MMFRRLILVVAAGLVLVVAAAGTGFTAPQPIKIGAALNLSGSWALTGHFSKNAYEMAVEDINRQGGINGRPLQLVIEDTESTQTGSITAVTRLIDFHKVVAVLLPSNSVIALAVKPYVEQRGIPTMIQATNPKLTAPGNKWYFRTAANDSLCAVALAKFAVDDLKATRLGIIHDSDEFGTTSKDTALQYLSSIGVKPVAIEAYNGGDKDFTAQLLNLSRKNVDVLLGWGHPTESGLIQRQIRQLGLQFKIVGSPSWANPVSLNLAKEAAEGLYSVIDYVPTNPDPIVQEWAKRYKERFNVESEFFAAFSYDGLCLLAEALRRAKSTNPNDIRNAMLSIKDYRGVISKWSFDENGDAATQVLIVQIVNGQPKIIRVVERPR